MNLKIVEKKSGQYGRLKMLKEIETFHHCQGHENILQLIEYFEEDNLWVFFFVARCSQLAVTAAITNCHSERQKKQLFHHYPHHPWLYERSQLHQTRRGYNWGSYHSCFLHLHLIYGLRQEGTENWGNTPKVKQHKSGTSWASPKILMVNRPWYSTQSWIFY